MTGTTDFAVYGCFLPMDTLSTPFCLLLQSSGGDKERVFDGFSVLCCGRGALGQT